MNLADQQNEVKRLLFVYKRVEEALYGSVYPLRLDATEATGEIALEEWESPFLVSKQLGEHEIVYGSLLHHMHEAGRPIFRIEALQGELEKALPSEIRASLMESRSGNEITFTSPTSELPALFLYQQDQVIKDAVLLSVSHMRTLLDLLSSKGNRAVPTYDYDGNPTGSVTIHQLFNALSHHRYCVVSAGFVCDIFSGDDTPGLPDLFGTKVKVEELLAASIGFLEGITVNDFVGILRGRLESLTVNSKPKDIIFAHQNVYALAEVVRCRLGDARFSPFLDYLFGEFTADEINKIQESKGHASVRLKRRFNLPRFTIGPDLDAKVIEMAITINDQQEKFEFRQQEFFENLTSTCGEESLILVQRLRQLIDTLESDDYRSNN